jgi:hypothetical protein
LGTAFLKAVEDIAAAAEAGGIGIGGDQGQAQNQGAQGDQGLLH